MEKMENSAHLIRHSKASYKNIDAIIASDKPQRPVDFKNQLTPDLPLEGLELAKVKASEFFSKLDPEKDAIFITSSNEARALETADEYRKIAHELGFEIIRPKNTRNPLGNNMGEGEIRVLQNLSLNVNDITLNCVFNTGNILNKVQEGAIDEETRQRFLRAREIIEKDNQKSWGGNFYKHSEEIIKILPELKGAKELYETQFKNILRLLNLGFSKVDSSNYSKNIKILGFGHENYLGIALEKYFGDHNIGNCEVINFYPKNNELTAEFKGKTANIN